MSFREENAVYKALRSDWLEIVNKAHEPGKGIRTADVEVLMLSSYRMMKFIRNYLHGNNVTQTGSSVAVPPLPEALRSARIIVEGKDGLSGLYFEAEKLEAVSRAAYRWLKENNRLSGTGNQ